MTKTADLVKRVENLENLISNLALDNEKKPKKTACRNVTEKGLLNKAKLAYYHEHKNTTAIKEQAKKLYGDDFESSFTEWRKVKVLTDKDYDKLSESEQERYVNAAKSSKSVSECSDSIDSIESGDSSDSNGSSESGESSK